MKTFVINKNHDNALLPSSQELSDTLQEIASSESGFDEETRSRLGEEIFFQITQHHFDCSAILENLTVLEEKKKYFSELIKKIAEKYKNRLPIMQEPLNSLYLDKPTISFDADNDYKELVNLIYGLKILLPSGKNHTEKQAAAQSETSETEEESSDNIEKIITDDVEHLITQCMYLHVLSQELKKQCSTKQIIYTYAEAVAKQLMYPQYASYLAWAKQKNISLCVWYTANHDSVLLLGTSEISEESSQGQKTRHFMIREGCLCFEENPPIPLEKLENIPKIFHFIWAGGEKPIHEPNMYMILCWHLLNPDCELTIWVDPKTTNQKTIQAYPEKLEELATQFFQGLQAEKQNMTVYQEKLQNLREKLTVKDINEFIHTPDYLDPVRYEIDQLYPNYGASSDLLRYRILEEKGGIYFDFDIQPLQPLPTLIFYQTQHCLYLDANSQGSGYIGNDAIISTRANPMMRCIRDFSERNYHNEQLPVLNEMPPDVIRFCQTPQGRLVNQAYCCQLPEQSEAITVRRTGPSCLRCVLYMEKNKITGKILALPTDVFSPDRERGRQWVDAMQAPQKLEDDNQLLECILRSIAFEGRVMGVLKLDDHFANLDAQGRRRLLEKLQTCLDSKVQQNTLETDLNTSLKEFRILQLTFQYPETLILYHHLRKVTTLEPFARTGLLPLFDTEDENAILDYETALACITPIDASTKEFKIFLQTS